MPMLGWDDVHDKHTLIKSFASPGTVKLEYPISSGSPSRITFLHGPSGQLSTGHNDSLRRALDDVA